MQPSHENKLTDVLQQLRELGFGNNFRIVGKRLKCIESEAFYEPNKCDLIASYRFEGPSNPDDEAILFVLRTFDGTGGTLVDAFGVLGNPIISDISQDFNDVRNNSTIMSEIPASRQILIVKPKISATNSDDSSNNDQIIKNTEKKAQD